jgi:hypothetical protein
LIGALIVLGIGAALGAKGNQDPHARVIAPVLFGVGGALIGGFNINSSTGALTAFTSPSIPAAGVTLLTVVKSAQ